MSADPAGSAPQRDPLAVARSRPYAMLLVLAAVIGAPISALAYGFLALTDKLQTWVFVDLPDGLGYASPPAWWPIPPLLVAGVLVGLCIRHLPGHGGESPADGFRAGRGPAPLNALPGIFLAAVASIGLGAVIGPEAPLIALGGGLSAAIVGLRRQAGPPEMRAILGATGSFAAVSALLGSPLVGAVLMMEASGLGGATMGLVLVPGLLASGVGYLVFVGLDSLTGLGTFSLALPDVEPLGTPRASEMAWAVGIGLGAAVLVALVRRLALILRPHVERRVLLLTPAAGLAVAGLAILFAETTDKPSSDVLFSGQTALGPLVADAATYSVGALILLGLCKAVAYGISLSAFRGGPVFPAMFLGAVGGILLSHLPGLPLITGVGIGVGAMLAAMLRLPIVAVLLTSVFLAGAGVNLIPPVIVAVVVAYAVSARFVPPDSSEPAAADGPAPA